MGDLLQTTIIVSILAATVRIATPLLLAALGELITERAGILNLGVEGNMLMSAFGGFLATYISGFNHVFCGLLFGYLLHINLDQIFNQPETWAYSIIWRWRRKFANKACFPNKFKTL